MHVCVGLTSGLRLLTSNTEFPGNPVTPERPIRPVIAEVEIARGPSAPGTAETDKPGTAKSSKKAFQ